MRKFVITRHNLFGIHYWENAPEDVGFLRSPHAHIFYITVKVEVTHSDRQVEFFQLRLDLVETAKQVFAALECNPKQSCEMLAEQIGGMLRVKYNVIEVSVSEDNQQDGVVIWD